ncbi:type 1 glutamine amidotransferase [Halomonas shantousis]
MHIYFLQHTPFAGPARLADWLAGMGHSYNTSHLYAGEAPPRFEDFDALILLGGPPESGDTTPDWLKRERKLLARVLKSGKPLLGIGFGAQLIAESLGAIVSPGTYAETGWHAVTLAPESPFDLPESFEAFHWHRDIFGLPEDALPLGYSDASPVQGFAWDRGRVLALQCHLEMTPTMAEALLAHDREIQAAGGPFVQGREEMLATPQRFDRLASLLDRVMMHWLSPMRTA